MKPRSEHLEQKDVVNYFHRTWPDLKLCIWACPSGFVAAGKNKFGIINKMKAEGWKKGVSDLQIAVPRGVYHGLFIEMKKTNGELKDVSEEQIAFIDKMKAMGYFADWAAGYEDAKQVVDEYMALK